MNTVKIWNDNPSDKQLDEIAAILEDGQTAIIPTDTMYALTCDAMNMRAIERICRLKGINPEKTNLSILCSDISMASEYARIDNKGFSILKNETPGPVTLLFRTVSSLPRAFKNRKTVGIRIPDSHTARSIVERLGRPLLTTTIQYEDEDYATNPELIAETYDNQIDLMVDAGKGGMVQSTIIDCTDNDPVVVRE
jgi:sua5/yciO/yrdC/ywlC family protein